MQTSPCAAPWTDEGPLEIEVSIPNIISASEIPQRNDVKVERKCDCLSFLCRSAIMFVDRTYSGINGYPFKQSKSTNNAGPLKSLVVTTISLDSDGFREAWHFI